MYAKVWRHATSLTRELTTHMFIDFSLNRYALLPVEISTIVLAVLTTLLTVVILNLSTFVSAASRKHRIIVSSFNFE